VSLLDELGIDPEDFTWHDLALCDGIEDPEIFFSKYEADEEVAKQADQVCLHCPVMKQCALMGQKGEYGQWGGIFWNGSGKPDKNRNSHKTPEVWAEIEKRLNE
jgi:hypothetical protein